MRKETKFKAWSLTKSKMAKVLSLHWDEFGKVISARLAFDDHESECSANTFVLLEYVGLNDFEKKEIYDGDIISGQFETEFGSFTPMNAEIIFCKSHGAYECKRIEKKVDEGQHWSIGSNVKVVGTIYEPNIIR